MGYKDILVQVDDTSAGFQRAAAAAGIASQSGASLIGVFNWSRFLENLFVADGMAYMAPADIDRVLKEHQTAVEKAAEAARMNFETAASESGVVSDWMTLGGADNSDLIAAARRTDLCVLPAAAMVPLGDHTITAAAIGLATGGPVLVMPDRPSPEIGRRIIVAWNGSREAARAVRDAGPLLDKADHVSFVVVAPKGEDAPDELLQRHIERRGWKAEVIEDRSKDEAAADVLRKQVHDLKADLLVMGLYGRSRVQEIVLGGVSQDLVRHPPVPLLVSH